MKKYYSLQSYFWYLRQFKVRMLLIFLMFAGSSALLSTIPVFIGRLVGAASQDPFIARDVWHYVIILVVISSAHDVLWRLSEVMFMKYANPLTYRYETEIFRQVLAKPYPFFIGKFTGKIASYVTSLGKELHQFVDQMMYNYAYETVRALSVVAILFSVNSTTGYIFLLGAALMIIVGRHTIGNSITYEAKFTDVESTKNGKIIDVIANFINVKSFHKEPAEHKRLALEQEHVIKAANTSFAWAIFFWATMSFVVRNMIWPATIIVNVYFYIIGVSSLAELTTLLSTIMLFAGYVWEFIWYISQFNLKLARMEEAHRYLFGEQVVHALRTPPADVAEPELDFAGELTLKKLNFAYPDQAKQAVLKDINLTIKKGEKIGIVGKSGSGKTTLVKLLLGYYEEYGGDIDLDGLSVSSRQLLNIISYVPQDSTLFNRTIAENISYAVDRTVTRREIIAASKRALADEFIKDIPKTYDAVVGERGVKLSTGQRQRIAIARAMLQKRPLLILDEATSALDSENEALVQKSLENLWDEHTVISIAHRLSTLRKMDRIIVFDDGAIVEQGTMKQLLKQKGAFYALWNHQVNGMIIE